MTCLGEMATYMPGKHIATNPIYKMIILSVIDFIIFCIVSGSFNHYATRFIDPAFGFALGWNYW